MATFDAYTPIVALLVHDTDANGIRAVINAVSAALIPASGVVVSRERFAAAPRRAGPPSSSVAVIPVAERDPIPVGIGWDEVAEAFEVEVSVRRKDVARGSTTLATLKAALRAIRDHYRGTAIAITGVTMRAISVGAIRVDGEPEADEIAHGVVPMTWRYLLERRANS